MGMAVGSDGYCKYLKRSFYTVNKILTLTSLSCFMQLVFSTPQLEEVICSQIRNRLKISGSNLANTNMWLQRAHTLSI